MEYGNRIKKIRNTYSDSLKQMEEKIGISKGYISGWEKGHNKFNPTLETLLNILKSYPQINYEWLLFGKGEMFYQSEKTFTEVLAEEDSPGYQTKDTLISHLEKEIKWLRKIIDEKLEIDLEEENNRHKKTRE